MATIETDDYEITLKDSFLKIDGDGYNVQTEFDSVDSDIKEQDPDEGHFHIVHRLKFHSDGQTVLTISRYQHHVTTISIYTEKLDSRVSVTVDELVFSELWSRLV